MCRPSVVRSGGRSTTRTISRGSAALSRKQASDSDQRDTTRYRAATGDPMIDRSALEAWLDAYVWA